MRFYCKQKELRRQRMYEKALDACATSPFARGIQRWVLAGGQCTQQYVLLLVQLSVSCLHQQYPSQCMRGAQRLAACQAGLIALHLRRPLYLGHCILETLLPC